MKFEIDHVAISVKDLTQTIAWYARLFGFQLAQTFERPDLGAKGAFLKLGGVSLEVFEFQNSDEVPDYRKGLPSDLRVHGTKHFALRVKDVNESVEDLRKQGVEFVMEPVIGGSGRRYVFFRDPDGILVELIEATQAKGA
jgi:lactoylglutathione lyase